eukprot:scaffold25016_cov129-Isochrysis_galbana.AAC.1
MGCAFCRRPTARRKARWRSQVRRAARRLRERRRVASLGQEGVPRAERPTASACEPRAPPRTPLWCPHPPGDVRPHLPGQPLARPWCVFSRCPTGSPEWERPPRRPAAQVTRPRPNEARLAHS